MNTGKEQLISMLNSEGVRRQQLVDCVIEAKHNKREKFTEITFGTSCADVVDACNGQKMVGIIIWVPRDVYDANTKKTGE
ncbi:hypothetical protein R9X49_06380 [Pectobacterium carotovorum]|uniref:hypothetical protein n=1 Tax=Pectobacterium carotovorum TaxID=554 RepID=UPI0029DB7929|nr:hypothetical protein [Pectobacterium carotovorum]MDX6914732.1 hypothetical protein [Pectobacterium carotovorum]